MRLTHLHDNVGESGQAVHLAEYAGRSGVSVVALLQDALWL